MRVHALAKEFDIKSTDFVDIIQSFGINVKSHLSSLDDAQVADIRFKMDMKDHTKEAELSGIDMEELNPLGNLAQEEADEIVGKKVVIETNDQGESAEEYSARRREEIIEEKKKIEQREKEEEIIKHAKLHRQEQIIKMERAGFWGWLRGFFG